MSDLARKRAAMTALPIVRLDHLWALFAVCIIGVFVSMAPTSPNDFWWHLKIGELVATSGIPATNRFAWTLPADTPYVYQSWLGEWLFYALYRLGGFPLVVFARNALVLGTFALVAYEAARRSGSWRLAAGVVLLAAAMTINNLTTRTQIWSWMPFVLVLVLLGRYVDQRLAPRWLAVLPLLMMFWVNVHGAFVLGLLVAAAFAAGETLRRMLRQSRALTWDRLQKLYLAFGAMILATLVNPLGIGVFGYIQRLLADPAVQGLINEWQPPTPDNLAGRFFFLSVLAILAAFAFARRRPSITEVVLVCGLTWQAFSSVRNVVWFALAVMPILAQSLAAPRAILTSESHRSPRERGGGTAANTLLAVLLVSGVIALQPWFKPALPLPEPYQALFAPVPGGPQLFTADTPILATEHLREMRCAGHLFNEMGYGSYLIWAAPEQPVFIDPRIELFPLSLWQDYRMLTEGRDVVRLLDEYAIACVMLDRGHQPELAEVMPTLSGWQQTYADPHSEVWRRTP